MHYQDVVDLKKIGQRTLWIDCDVLQADGGTRTASITGACVATAIACNRLISSGKIKDFPLSQLVAAERAPQAQQAAKDLIAAVDGRPIDDAVSEETAQRIARQRATDEAQPPCWCTTAHFPPDLLARLPAEAAGKACICGACLATFNPSTNQVQP